MLNNKKIHDGVKVVMDMNPQQRREVFQNVDTFPIFFAYYFPHYIQSSFADFHFQMFDDLSGLTRREIKELVFIMFRESAKTSIAKVFLTYLICTKQVNYPLVVSYDKKNSEMFLFDVANNLATNKPLTSDFGRLYTREKRKDDFGMNRISKFLTTNGILVEALSTQESVRGRLHDAHRPDYINFDDIETNKTKDSKAYIDQVRKFISEALTGMDSDGMVLYLANYITEFGVVQDLMNRQSKTDRMVVRNMPVLIDNKPTWPQKYTTEALDAKKIQVGPAVFSAEYLNQPIDQENAVFKKEWFKYKEMEEVEVLHTRNFLMIDTKATDAAFEGGDYIGVALCFVDEYNNWYVQSSRMKLSTKGLVDLLFNWYTKYNIEIIGMERMGFQQGMKQYLEDEMSRRNKFMSIQEVSHKNTSKNVRIQNALEPRYNAGKIFHITMKGVNLSSDLEDELERFPKAVNDDASDATAHLDTIAQPPANQLLTQLLDRSTEEDILADTSE